VKKVWMAHSPGLAILSSQESSWVLQSDCSSQFLLPLLRQMACLIRVPFTQVVSMMYLICVRGRCYRGNFEGRSQSILNVFKLSTWKSTCLTSRNPARDRRSIARHRQTRRLIWKRIVRSHQLYYAYVYRHHVKSGQSWALRWMLIWTGAGADLAERWWN
jgi:hypothetical protein